MTSYRARRVAVVIILLLISAIPLASQPAIDVSMPWTSREASGPVLGELEQLPVKGRAPKTGYERSQFGNGWSGSLGCDTRNQILARDLTQVVVDDDCRVRSGVLHDPYTNKIINFSRGAATSSLVQVDHVVALSDAWQKGAQQLSYAERISLANDPLNLLAVDGASNQQKSDGDAATWLPPNKAFRCQYVQRQVKVKKKYELWVTSAEREAIRRVLMMCTRG